jgi:hypothetical protein
MRRLWLLLAIGCTTNPLPPAPSPALVAASCKDNGADCDAADQCCSGYCQLHGVYSEDWRTCVAPLADGQYCIEDGDCASRQCLDYRCGGVGACAGQGCGSDGDCCRGTYCYNETYAPFTCELLSPDGQWCTADSHCQSGHCRDYTCAP